MEELLIYIKIVKRRWPFALVTFMAVFYFLGYQRSKETVPLYRATGTIIFDQQTATITDPFSLGGQNKLTNDLVLIKSESLAEKVKKDLEFSLEMDTKKLLQNLVAINPEKSDVIQLSFTDEDPKKASEIVNAWINNYVQLDKDQKVSQTKELAKFLEKQIPESQKSLESTAEKLKNFKQDNRILDITAEATSTITIISQLDSQIATIQADLAAQKSRRDSLKQIFSVDAQSAITSSFVSESPIVASLVKQIEEIKTKIEQEKVRFGDRHPQVITLQKQEAVLQEQLAKYAQNTNIQGNLPQNLEGIYQPGTTQSTLLAEYATTERQIQSLEAQLSSLKDLINVYRQRVDVLPNLEFQQQQLQRELTARSDVLQNLIKNYQDAQIAINNTQGNIRSAELATIPKEAAINRRLSYLFQGFLGGILAGSIVAYLVEKLDQKVNSIEQVKEYFEQPVMGKIPDFNRRKKDEIKSNLPTRDNPSSPISENFRALCTSINFMTNNDKPLKVITISSSVAGEGKSTIAANIAVAAAGLGSKVLLMEADLRKPGQRKIWENIDKKAGLSDLLHSDGQSELSESVVTVMPNLDILPAGNTKSNPVALIGSAQMVHLLEKIRDEYDLVIIDAPPVSVAADAQILSRMSDGMLMVIRQGKATNSILANAAESLLQAEVNVLGILLNCFTSDSDSYYYYYNYSYYYDKKDKKKSKLFG
ncbi:MAG: polysaccharide biosynthesis tyrosine autokinase [Cyanobacteria bacterium]|nr:polysaccharide biosynthesis tyrosine autokinase [Cyanobacteria bacterium CG_2015-16_32_12]NCO78157.1 polysaccharide biosynthesis tyrosine autokinase [Cyanobacteria bacterium CG_2015-22_32_23]NCQ03920.1 polysaccharide biosynthesis tyrosine autokinase [Cyanobacteria bacterium CG_2015-09_32_10]NCQ42027.1 polysaccharide biosynthesis tyrosine autokinase [Cyanobacteria bacterium CG_2015-04_32_10]NCS84148.1 polysaccharide biosynthesis tyrosine autokinase [Cyanobacteria bacterium CG_2015-02_32_10]